MARKGDVKMKKLTDAQKRNAPERREMVEFWSMLPDGHMRAITLSDLAAVSYMSERGVKRMVQHMRLHGYPVLTHPDGGYFIPDIDDPVDMTIARDFMFQMRSQALSRLTVVKRMETWFKRLGQVEFDDVYDIYAEV